MSYYSATVRPWSSPNSKTLGFASLLISLPGGQAQIEIKNFKIVQGPKGPFVSWPQDKPFQNKEGKTVYPRAVKVLEQRAEGSYSGPVETQMSNVILEEYRRQAGSAGQMQAVQGQMQSHGGYDSYGQPQGSNGGGEPPRRGGPPAGW